MLIDQNSEIIVGQNSENMPELLQKMSVFWGRFIYLQVIEMIQDFQFVEIHGKSLGISWLP